MTRVTSIGWKRTYVEAGFDHTEPSEPSQENAGNSPIAGDTSNGENAIPLKKKRKRTPKSKRDNYGGGLIEKVKEGNASDATSGQQVKLVQAATEGRAEGRQQAKVKKRTTTIRGGMERGVKYAPAREMHSEIRRQKRVAERQANTTCFACRAKGHAARDCPTNIQQGERSNAVGICYRCGSPKHTLASCKKPADLSNPLPFASCFVCSGKGHLASSCPQNKAKGIYPDGGCCKLCGDTTHLAKDCGLRRGEQTSRSMVLGVGCEAGADEDDFHALKREVAKDERREAKAKRIINAKAGVFLGVQSSGRPVSTKKVVYF